jgi:aconitate hydratase
MTLRIVELLREHGVVSKFVEFYGSGMANLSLPDRATIANMAPEYGATCGFFPVDQTTLDYMHLSGREPSHIENVKNILLLRAYSTQVKPQYLNLHPQSN